MPISEDLAQKLQEAVDNNQVRLANTYFLQVLAEIVPVLQETVERVQAIEEFLSSDDSDQLVAEDLVVNEQETEKKSKTSKVSKEKN
jgi:hypothetical protein